MMKLLRRLFTDYNMNGLQAIGLMLGILQSTKGNWLAATIIITVFTLLGSALAGNLKT